MNELNVTAIAPQPSHRFEARILQHRHVVGQIIVCGRCGRTAYECVARGEA